MKKLILLAVLCTGAAFLMPKAPVLKAMDINQIQTTSAKKFPRGTFQGCNWFCEQVIQN